MEYITVNLFRVSQESVYLDVIAECLCGYIFNKIEVGIRTYDHYGNALTENNYSLTDAILSEYYNNQTAKISTRIPLSEFFGEGEIPPAIYTLTLGCVNEDGQISQINLIQDKFYVSASGNTSNRKVNVTTNDLRLINSEELSKIEDSRYLDGYIEYRTADGELLDISSALKIKGPSGGIGITISSGSIGIEPSSVASVAPGFVLLQHEDNSLNFDNSDLIQEYYISGEKSAFHFSGSLGVVVGQILPQPYPIDDCRLSLSLEYGDDDLILTPDVSIGKFEAGDEISATMEYLDSWGSGYIGLALRQNNGSSEKIIYDKSSVSPNTYLYIRYTLSKDDIFPDGSIRIIRSGYSNTGFSYFSITRTQPPSYPDIVISGDLTIPKVGIPNTDVHEVTVHTSDINGAFQYIMDNILNLENSCTPISDEAIRNYLILYGHLQALENGQQSIAEEYFKILVKNFTKCGNNSRACGGPCGCQSSPCGPNQHNQHPTHNSCNCNS